MNYNTRAFLLSIGGAAIFGIALFNGVYSGIQTNGASLWSLIILFILGGGTFSLIAAAWVKFCFNRAKPMDRDGLQMLDHYKRRSKELWNQLNQRRYQLEAIHLMLMNVTQILLGKTKFVIGAPVHKPTGYNYEGTIQSVFTNTAGEIRYVVENTQSAGMLHIFNEGQLAHGTYADAEKYAEQRETASDPLLGVPLTNDDFATALERELAVN